MHGSFVFEKDLNTPYAMGHPDEGLQEGFFRGFLHDSPLPENEQQVLEEGTARLHFSQTWKDVF